MTTSTRKPSGGRMRDLRAPPSQNVISSMVTNMAWSSNLNESQVPQVYKAHIARPLNHSTRGGRSFSVSAAEEFRPSLSVHAAPLTTSRVFSDSRPSLLPRRASISSSADQQRLVPIRSPTVSDVRPSPSALGAVFASVVKDEISPGHRGRALRRKAPTIGKQAELSRFQSELTSKQKLSVTIPTPLSEKDNMEITSQIVEARPSSERSGFIGEKEIDRSVEYQLRDGPKELASLRTTIDTQSLPPPTPIFPSASTPSTRYSESPGVWSRTSQTSTPTSLLSYSPGIMHSGKSAHRLRQQSPSQSRLPISSPTPRSGTANEATEAVPPKVPSQSRLVEHGIPSYTREQIKLGQELEIGYTSASAALTSPPPKGASSSRYMERESTAVHKQEKFAEQSAVDSSKVLNSAIADSVTLQQKRAPPRPSREGTQRLELQASPVIQSNLSSLSVAGHKRRESGSNLPVPGRWHPTPVRSAAASVDSIQTTSSSRVTSRSADLQAPSRKSTRTLTKEPRKKQEPTSIESPKRFGLFSRKPKSETNLPDTGTSARKGPSAGTGHEGYGKYAQRGRKGSVSSGSDTRARSTSTSRSVASKGSSRGRRDLDIDDFLYDRLEPVIIQGGGQDGACLVRTQSGQSVSTLSTDSISPHNMDAKMPQGTEYSTESLISSAVVSDNSSQPGQSRSIGRTYAKDAPSSRLALKLSAYDHKNREYQKNAMLPATLPFIDSFSSIPPTTAVLSSSQRPRTDSASNRNNRTEKKGKGLKWNVFQKSPGNERKNLKSVTPHVDKVPPLHAAVSSTAAHRAVAHYAIVDRDSDPLEKILQGVEDSSPTDPAEDQKSRSEIPVEPNTKQLHGQSILLPSPPQLQSEFASKDGRSSPKVFFIKDLLDTDPKGSENKRPSRLASVGRIPRVVSRRDRQHKPDIQSFSRPFSYGDTPAMTAVAPSTSAETNNAPHEPQSVQTDLLHRETDDYKGQPITTPIQASLLEFLSGPYSKHEFLAFRKGSSSSGSQSLAAVTAMIPEPDSSPTEDEVWSEYDGLIDHVLSSPESANGHHPHNSNVDGKLELATRASKRFQAELNTDASARTPSTSVEPLSVTLANAPTRSSSDSIRLRRSQIAPALHSPITASTQASYSDLIADYGKMSNDTDTPEAATNLRNSSDFLLSSSISEGQSYQSSRKRNTMLFDIAERGRDGTLAQANIRSGSLMTSRWLSFGRVLFSPAHSHVQSTEREKILVLDGLGNDDWSFYCALTYSTADIYSLDIGPSSPASTHPSAWQPPKNHYTVSHPTLEEPLPFPNGLFKVVVLRFLAACSEVVQRNMILEFKRVLKTGGYLEMSILDLDMMNMGIRTRRAVRHLKEKTFMADPNISLKPASDSIQRLLGQYGFDNLRRCMVQIPVEGVTIRSSSDSSTSNQSATAATAIATPSTGFSLLTTSTTSTGANNLKSPSDNLSLGDLLSDPCPSPKHDESIAKMVAKVGRWWYTRCYEIPVLPDGDLDSSIWADRALLRECRKRATGFKFLIAYAQKPSEVMRRTASV